jgi:hypothetical protein
MIRFLADADFNHVIGEFLARGKSSPGVFLVSQRAPISDVIEQLVLIWAASHAADSYTARPARVRASTHRVHTS